MRFLLFSSGTYLLNIRRRIYTLHFTTDEIQMIRNERRQYEETGKIPANILEFIYNKQLFKLIVPEAFGGKMLDLPSATRIFQQAAYIDGNFG